jgi:lipopolysaccharide heptosyltransferase II
MQKSVIIQVPEKILIIRLSSIGDILLTTPVIRLLKQKFSDSKIDFVIKKEFAELLIYHPGIHQLYIFNKNGNFKVLKDIKQRIKNEKYDLIVDFHKNFRSFYLTKFSRAKRVIRYKKGVIRRFLSVKFKLNLYREIIPIYLRYLNCLKPFQIFYDDQGLNLFFNDEKGKRIFNKYSQFLKVPESPIIGIAPGAKHATKRWIPEGFSAVINYLTDKKKSKIIIFGSRADQEIVQSLDIENHQCILDATGRLSLLESAILMNHCDLVLTNDSGLMHLASALKKKVVAIFGSTTEELGFFPYTTEHIVIQNNNLCCRPCSHVGRKKCPKGHFKCMKEITAEQVISAVEELLGK